MKLLKFQKIILLVLTLIIFSFAVNGAILDNLSAHYSLDYTPIKSNLSSVNNGSLVNAIITTTKSKLGGGSLYCDGTGDYLSLTDTNDVFDFGSGQFTINLWYNTTTPNKNILTRTAGTTYPPMMVSLLAGTPDYFDVYMSVDGSSWAFTNSSKSFTQNAWTMMTITRNSSHIIYYRNGVFNNSAPNTVNIPDKSESFILCAAQSSNWFTGWIDEVSFWKGRAITQAEITTIYNNGTGLQYPFTEPPLPPVYNVTLLNKTPIDITTNNALGIGANFTYFGNTTNLNTTSALLYWNVSTVRGFWSIVNGSIEQVNKNKTYYKSVNNNYSFWLDDNDIYPSVMNLDDELFTNTPHSAQSLGANDYLKTKLIGINSSLNYSIVEIMINGSGNCRIFYCNESYTTGMPTTNQNCNEFGDFTGFNINHSINQSFHNLFSFPFFNKTIGTVGVTNLSYFLVKGVLAGGCNVFYINQTTRNDTEMLSTNLGISYSIKNYTADLHVHQYDETEVLNYYSCIKNTSQTEFCSSVGTDNLDLTIIPPTNPQIYKPDSNITDILIINFSVPNVMNGVNITRYEVYILNITDSGYLLYNNTLLTYFNYGNITSILNWSYGREFYIRVKTFDTNNQSSTENSDVFYNIPPPPSASELSAQLLADINQSLNAIKGLQTKDSGGINMIGLYIMLTALTIFAFIYRDNAVKIIIAILNIFIGLKAITIGGADAMIGVVIICISLIMFAMDIEN